MFRDQPAAVAAFPLAYLIVGLLYSANSAPWGQAGSPRINLGDERPRLGGGLVP
jgi:hypothetical protein